MATSWSSRIGASIAIFFASAACSSLLGYDEVSFDDDRDGGKGGFGAHAAGGSGGGASGSGATTNGGSAGGGSFANGGVAGTAGTGGTGGTTPTTGGNAGTGGVLGGGSGGALGGGTGGVLGGGTGGVLAGGTGGGPSGGTGGGTSDAGTADQFEAARQLCIDHINKLRATKGLPPYKRWTSAEACVDLQVTDDQITGIPHNAWKTHKFACNGYGMAQNECLGSGASGIVGCLDMMWAEKDQPGCAGCDACTWPTGCANCDFYGDKTGDVCGHYVNMRATWMSMAACGFSAGGSRAAINFQ